MILIAVAFIHVSAPFVAFIGKVGRTFARLASMYEGSNWVKFINFVSVPIAHIYLSINCYACQSHSVVCVCLSDSFSISVSIAFPSHLSAAFISFMCPRFA